MQLLQTQRIDLMQVHNLLDWKIHLATLRGLKDAGRIRYLGVTHYTSSAYADLEEVLRPLPDARMRARILACWSDASA